jgi:hypothetical protein
MKTTAKTIMFVLLFFFLFGCSSGPSNDSSMPVENEQPQIVEESVDYMYDDYSVLEDIDYDEAPRSKSTTGSKDARERSSSAATSGNIDYSLIISSAATGDANIDENRKIIRRADLKFRVENVAIATYFIENITVKHGGWVSNSSLSSDIQRTNEIKITKIHQWLYRNMLYPISWFYAHHIKTWTQPLKSMVPLIQYLDYRTITAEDITFKKLAEKLKQSDWQNITDA